MVYTVKCVILQLAGSNFQASAPQEYEILVTFEAPLADYALENDTDIADENSTVDLSR